MRRLTIAATCVALTATSSALGLSALPGGPRLAGCPVFPATSPWNRRIDRLPRRDRIGGDGRVDRARRAAPRRLRLGAVGRRPDRDPDHRRRREDAARSAVAFTYASESDRVQVPDPGERADRGRDGRVRRRPARDPRRPRRLPALRAVRAAARRRRTLERRLGSDLGPALEQAPAGRLDVRRRRRATHPPRARALRRGRVRPDPACAALHGLAHAQRVRLAGAPRGERPHGPGAARHGDAPPAAPLVRRIPASRGRRGSSCARCRSTGRSSPTTARTGSCRACPTHGGRTTTCRRSGGCRGRPGRWSTGRRSAGAEGQRSWKTASTLFPSGSSRKAP